MSDIKSDPKERDPRYRSIIAAAKAEAEKIVADMGISGLGTCHAVWGEQKRILKEKHNIDWQTPAEMNPLVMFD